MFLKFFESESGIQSFNSFHELKLLLQLCNVDYFEIVSLFSVCQKGLFCKNSFSNVLLKLCMHVLRNSTLWYTQHLFCLDKFQINKLIISKDIHG